MKKDLLMFGKKINPRRTIIFGKIGISESVFKGITKSDRIGLNRLKIGSV